MKRIYLHILVSVMAALTLAACDKEDAEPTTVRDYPTFSATIKGTGSRAYDTSWEADDQIGVTVTSGSVSGGNVTGGGATNLSYSHQGNGNFTVTDPTKQIVFDNENIVHFKAYYPYRSNRPSSGTITGINTTNQSNQKSFDFLWAEGDGSKAGYKVNLAFEHKMCKVTFVLKKDADIVDLESISSFKLTGVNLTSGSFNTNTGICSANKTTSSSAVTVTPAEIKVDGDEAVTSFILCPQELKAIPVPFQIIDKSGYTYNCDLPFNSTRIEGGNNYQFVIKLSKVNVEVTNLTIKGWEEIDRGDSWEAL